MTAGVYGNLYTNPSTYIRVAVEYSESYNTTNNTSDVTATLWYQRTNSYQHPTYAYGNYQVNINGTLYTVYTGTFTIPAYDNEWKRVGSQTVYNIAHNADGNKTIKIGGKFVNTGSGTSVMDFNFSENVALTKISRMSYCSATPNPLTLSSATNTLTVSTNRASNDFTHTITVTAGSYTETKTGVGSSTTFPVPYTVVGDMTASQMNCTIECTTYNGTSQVGSKTSTTFKVQVDSSIEKATISSVTLSDTNATSSALETSGTFIKGYSNLQAVVAFTASGTYTTLKSYSISYDGTTQTDDLSGTSGSATFTKNGVTSATMTITVTDNRNTVTTYTQSVTLIDYRPVGFSEISIYRVNSNDQPTETGDYIHYEIKVNCFDGSFGLGSNPITLGYKYKLASGSTYGAEATIDTHTGTSAGEYTTYTFSGIAGGGNLVYSSEYNIIFTLSDTFTSATSTMQVLHQGIPVFAWGEDHFDIYGALHLHDRTDVSNFIALNASSVKTEAVTFSGADGGSVNWTVFTFGSLVMAVSRWRSASNATINNAWNSWYTSTSQATPDFPVAFTTILYQNIKYVAADSGYTGSAITGTSSQAYTSSGISTTNMGNVWLFRPDSGVTVGHPVYVQIVIGTV